MRHESFHPLLKYQSLPIHFQQSSKVFGNVHKIHSMSNANHPDRNSIPNHYNDHKSSLDNNAVLEDQMPIPNLNIVNMDFSHPYPDSHLLFLSLHVSSYNLYNNKSTLPYLRSPFADLSYLLL